MVRRSIIIAGFLVGALVVPTGIASAHECYVASRSDQGNASATRSPIWNSMSVGLLLEIGHEFGITGWDEELSPEQLAQVANELEALGFSVDDTITTHALRTLPNAGPTGKGIDHYDFGAVVGVVLSVLND